MTDTSFAARSCKASGVLVQGGFAAFMIWGQILAGAVGGGIETHSFPGCGFSLLSSLLQSLTWKWLLTEIKGGLETLWQPHHCLEYFYNGHRSTKETVAALLLLVTER